MPHIVAMVKGIFEENVKWEIFDGYLILWPNFVLI